MSEQPMTLDDLMLVIDPPAPEEIAHRKHVQDIQLIAAKLFEYAERMDWCEEFDRTLDELNEKLSEPLPVRRHYYNVEGWIKVKITGQVRVDRKGSEDDDELEDRARDKTQNLLNDRGYSLDIEWHTAEFVRDNDEELIKVERRLRNYE